MFHLMPWKKKEQKEVGFKRDFDSMVDRFWSGDFFPAAESFFEKDWSPSLDVTEGKKNITVKAEIPGVEASDINVTIDGRLLKITGEKKQEKEEKGTNFHQMERSYGYFSRVVELPAEVDEENVSASFQKGILKIDLKKTKESQTRKITVKAA